VVVFFHSSKLLVDKNIQNTMAEEYRKKASKTM
jgi:hypothetical protein